MLEVVGLPEPTFVNGVQQVPYEGVSMAYTFDEASAADRHETQYFEMFVNRGIYHKGWTAVTRHSTPWVMAQLPPFDDDVWELYAPDDWTQAHDLAAEQPERLHELQRLFLIEAARHNVLPLDDRRVERFNSDLAGRPQLIHGKRQLLFGGMGRLSENSVIVIKNKSHAVTAKVQVPDGGANGVIIAQGGAFGGWTLYAKDGKPAYCYNLFGLRRFKVYGDAAIPAGEHQVRMEFAYDGGGLGKGGTSRLFVDGAQGRRGPHRRHRADDLLGRRDDRPRPGHRHPGDRRLRLRRSGLHRQDPLGRDRHRRGRRGPRPPDHAGGADADRDGATVIFLGAPGRAGQDPVIGSRLGRPSTTEVEAP